MPAGTEEIIKLLDQIIERYRPGGEFGAPEEALLKREKVKSLAETQQGLVTAGLAGTTVGAGAGKLWEEEVGMPARLRLEDIRTQRLSEAMGAKAGYLERGEARTAETQQAAQQRALEYYKARSDPYRYMDRGDVGGGVGGAGGVGVAGGAGGYGAQYGGMGAGYDDTGGGRTVGGVYYGPTATGASPGGYVEDPTIGQPIIGGPQAGGMYLGGDRMLGPEQVGWGTPPDSTAEAVGRIGTVGGAAGQPASAFGRWAQAQGKGLTAATYMQYRRSLRA